MADEMHVSELIAALEEVREEHGDVEVYMAVEDDLFRPNPRVTSDHYLAL